METRDPTNQEMQALVAFLPRLYAEGFEPVTRWHGGDRDQDDIIRMPWPEYHPLVEEFFRLVGSEYWLDYGYRPEEAATMIRDAELVRSASLAQIKTMLTFCLRGERFADGHWAEMIEKGYIRNILKRIDQLSRVALPGASLGQAE
jgi:Family of unknown function (DUF6508)